ncbi:MAG: HAD hydrolase family protein [Candidatus Methylomirabilota bacterium]
MPRSARRAPHAAHDVACRLPRGVAARARRIRLLVLDADGVLTDGRLHYGRTRETLMVFHVHDGLGIKLAQASGLIVAILSGRASPMLRRRAAELGVRDVYTGITDKGTALAELLVRLRIPAEETACMGDDLPDLPLLSRAGLSLSVPNGVPEARAAAHYVTRRPGGQGAVREAIELILKAQGRWSRILEAHR